VFVLTLSIKELPVEKKIRNYKKKYFEFCLAYDTPGHP